MKRFLLAAVMLPGLCFASPWDLTQGQLLADGATISNRLMPLPSGGGVDGVVVYDQASNLPKLLPMSGCALVSGVFTCTGSGGTNADWNAVSGAAQILNKPSLATVATSGSASDIASGTLNDARIPSLAIAKTTGLQTALDGKFASPSGTTAQYVRGDGTLATLPAPGTVTSVTAGTGLSGGTITTTGTISLPNTGTPSTYSGVTTDAQGRVTSGTTLSINDSPGRTLVTATNATGYQISSTRNARGCYEGSFSTTSSIGGPASASVFLETADTNSTTPGDWTTKARQTYSNTITLAVVLNQVQGNNWSICRDIPAGKFVRVRSGSITGTATASINTEQQEVLL